MAVIDIGCGCGDWLAYLASKGVEVAGINISAAQVRHCHARELEVYHVNWEDIASDPELRRTLYDRFDCVTFWDTVEHYAIEQPDVIADSVLREVETVVDNALKLVSGSQHLYLGCP